MTGENREPFQLTTEETTGKTDAATNWRTFIENEKKQKTSAGSKIVVLIGTLVFFVFMMGTDQILTTITILIPVIILHELGHLAAMKMFGYRDLSVFFIPLIGAAASGKEHRPSQSKRAIVSLMGPLPGIILGCVLTFATDLSFSTYIGPLISMLFILNLFNLLPINPMDGGRIVGSLMASRAVPIAILFTMLSPFVMLAIALLINDIVLIIFSALLLFGAISEIRLIRLVRDMKKTISAERAASLKEISDIDLMSIIEEIRKRYKKIDDRNLAQLASRTIDNIGIARASLGSTIGIMFGTFLVIVLGMSGLAVAGYQQPHVDPVFQGRHVNDIVTSINEGDEAAKNHAEITLKTALTQTDVLTKNSFASSLGSMGAEARNTACILTIALDNEIDTMQVSKGEWAPDLGAILNFIEAIGEIGPQGAQACDQVIESLASALNHPDCYVRQTAAIAIGKMEKEAASLVTVLAKIIESEPDNLTRDAMGASLAILISHSQDSSTGQNY